MRARETKMMVGMATWMSARAATVVDSVPPTLVHVVCYVHVHY